MNQTIKKIFGRIAPAALLGVAVAASAGSAFAQGAGVRGHAFVGGGVRHEGGYGYRAPVREFRREYVAPPRTGFYFGFGTPYYTAPAPVYGYAPAPACGYYDRWGYWHTDPACYTPYYGYPR